MKMIPSIQTRTRIVSLVVATACLIGCSFTAGARPKTMVSIAGQKFHINGEPTYKGVTWQGNRIEGLLMNARLVQGIFDDLNPETRDRWAYPDTGVCPSSVTLKRIQKT